MTESYKKSIFPSKISFLFSLKKNEKRKRFFAAVVYFSAQITMNKVLKFANNKLTIFIK